MRIVALAFLLAVAAPAQAQRASDLPGRPAPVALTDDGSGSALSLGQLFNAETVRFSQSYELSYSSGLGGGVGLGVYTTSLRWQPSARLAGRVDVGVAHSPFGDGAVQGALGFDGAGDTRVFLRNAELAWRPTENATLHLSVRQSPYGAYASPYGYAGYGRYGYGYGRTGLSATFAPAGSDRLFFRDGQE
jgi:hypothetical protein